MVGMTSLKAMLHPLGTEGWLPHCTGGKKVAQYIHASSEMQCHAIISRTLATLVSLSK